MPELLWTLYEMEPIGVDGTFEATMQYAFCSEACADTYAEVHTGLVFSKVLEPDTHYEEGHECDHCGETLTIVGLTAMTEQTATPTKRYITLLTARYPTRSDGRSYQEIMTENPHMEWSWIARHRDAVSEPKGAETPIVGLFWAWLTYADTHRARFESGIGEDYVLGPVWATIGRSLRELLNSDCGRLDCGTLDGIVCNVLAAEGFEVSE